MIGIRISTIRYFQNTKKLILMKFASGKASKNDVLGQRANFFNLCVYMYVEPCQVETNKVNIRGLRTCFVKDYEY